MVHGKAYITDLIIGVSAAIFQIYFQGLKKTNIDLIFIIDSTIIRAHQHAAGAVGGQEKQGIGRSSGGLTSRLHTRVGSSGKPDLFILSAGQDHDITQAKNLCADLEVGSILLADKGYDCSDFRISLLLRNIKPEIPSRKNRIYKPPYEKERFKKRCKVEMFFARLKQYRGFSTRYDKLAHSYLSQIALACAIVANSDTWKI